MLTNNHLITSRNDLTLIDFMTVAIADSVDASPQTSIKSWTCGDVKKWLNEVGLENRLESELQNSFFSLTALGLMSFSSACP